MPSVNTKGQEARIVVMAGQEAPKVTRTGRKTQHGLYMYRKRHKDQAFLQEKMYLYMDIRTRNFLIKKNYQPVTLFAYMYLHIFNRHFCCAISMCMKLYMSKVNKHNN